MVFWMVKKLVGGVFFEKDGVLKKDGGFFIVYF